MHGDFDLLWFFWWTGASTHKLFEVFLDFVKACWIGYVMYGGNDSVVWWPLWLCWCVEVTTNKSCFSNESCFSCGYANVWSFLLCVVMLIWEEPKRMYPLLVVGMIWPKTKFPFGINIKFYVQFIMKNYSLLMLLPFD